MQVRHWSSQEDDSFSLGESFRYISHCLFTQFVIAWAYGTHSKRKISEWLPALTLSTIVYVPVRLDRSFAKIMFVYYLVGCFHDRACDSKHGVPL